MKKIIAKVRQKSALYKTKVQMKGVYEEIFTGTDFYAF